MDAIPDARTLDALDHVERNGSLAWSGIPTHDIGETYADLEAKGYVRRDAWSGRLVLTEAAGEARRRSDEIERLMEFARRMSRPRG